VEKWHDARPAKKDPHMSDVFISYARGDQSFTDRLVRDLEAAGLTVFFDRRVVGESWAASLSEAIEAARFVLVVLSPEALYSKWIHQEMMLGLARETQGRTKVIPLMVRECEPPVYLAARTWADFTKDYDVGLQQLLPVLTRPAAEASPGAPGNVAREIAPAEIAQLRAELKEAVTLFKAAPQREPAASLPPPRQRKKCFIIMPFGAETLQIVFEDFVRPVIEGKCDLDCERGDDVFGSNVIVNDIRDSIERADIVVADLTGKNPNVFYEVGICHTLDKPVLLMAQSIDDVPFDLRHRRVLLYEYSPRGCKKLEKALHENLMAMLQHEG
jgi:hypothetical protein